MKIFDAFSFAIGAGGFVLSVVLLYLTYLHGRLRQPRPWSSVSVSNLSDLPIMMNRQFAERLVRILSSPIIKQSMIIQTEIADVTYDSSHFSQHNVFVRTSMSYDFVNVSPNAVEYNFRLSLGPSSRFRSLNINGYEVAFEAPHKEGVDDHEGPKGFSYPLTLKAQEATHVTISWSEEVEKDSVILYAQNTPVVDGIEVTVLCKQSKKIEMFTSAGDYPIVQAPGSYSDTATRVFHHKWLVNRVMLPGEALILHISDG